MSRTVENVYDFIYKAIAGGRLRPGSHLAEEMIADELGVSRTPVREAIRRLEMDGLVVLTRNSGADVAMLSPEDIAETFNLRAMLEGYAAERAATRIRPDQLAALEEMARTLSAYYQTGTVPDFLVVGQRNADFHLTIAEAAQSRRLLQLIRSLVHLPLTIMHQEGWGPQLARSSGYEDHERIVEALRLGDPDLARTQMQLHILRARPQTPPRSEEAPPPGRTNGRKSPKTRLVLSLSKDTGTAP